MNSHHRVTPIGESFDQSAAHMAQQGREILAAACLAGVAIGRLRGEMCKTCACQPGSVPNGCLQTQLDFLKSVADGLPFECHSPANGSICAGWAQARAFLVENPMPAEIVAMLEGWKYSPPDGVTP